MVVEAIACLCSDRSGLADRRKWVAGCAKQIASSTAVMSGQDSHRFPKTYPFPIHVSQVLMCGYEAPSGGQKNTSHVKKGLVRLASKGTSEKVVFVSELGPTPPGAVRVASRTPGQFESFRADTRICQHFETSDVLCSRVC